MAQIKTAEATGRTLAYLVGIAERCKVETWHIGAVAILFPGAPRAVPWNPHTNWAQGGPIIEREGIQLRYVSFAGKLFWDASKNVEAVPRDIQFGDAVWFGSGLTPLIAAMRCFVASKLGDQIEVPDDLK